MRNVRSVFVVCAVVCLLAGPAVSVVAQVDVDPQAPTEVTGTIQCGPSVRTGTSEPTIVPLADGEMTVTRKRGDAWQNTATMSDSRLSGTYYISESLDEYRASGTAGAITAASGTRRIVNDEGAWQGSATYVYLPDGSVTGFSMVLTGEGAYEGMTVIWEELSPVTPCTSEVRGVIFEGEAPPTAEPFTSQ